MSNNGAGAGPETAPGSGIIPLRPLSLTDIFNGSVGYVRANPKATLGLTTVVVLSTTVLGFVLVLLTSSADGGMRAMAGLAIGGLAAVLAATLLSGMLPVIVARSVLGSSITVAEAWQRVRGRMAALVTLILLEIVTATVLIAAAVFAITGVGRAAGGWLAAVVGVPLILLVGGGITYLTTVLALAPAAIVLERRNVPDAIRRSLDLGRRRFWRMLGILVLAVIVAALVTGAVSVPFDVAGSVLSFGSPPSSPSIGATMLTTIGQAIGQVITAPFIAGVVTLLYVDARIRSEAFDFTLLRTSAETPDADDLWLGR